MERRGQGRRPEGVKSALLFEATSVSGTGVLSARRWQNAKAFGLTVLQPLLACANEVIE